MFRSLELVREWVDVWFDKILHTCDRSFIGWGGLVEEIGTWSFSDNTH